jgi:hypothetical protein
MADPNLYDFPSPLKGYEGLEPLPEYVSLTIPLCHARLVVHLQRYLLPFQVPSIFVSV